MVLPRRKRQQPRRMFVKCLFNYTMLIETAYVLAVFE
jgi:hypothetical protein